MSPAGEGEMFGETHTSHDWGARCGSRLFNSAMISLLMLLNLEGYMYAFTGARLLLINNYGARVLSHSKVDPGSHIYLGIC